MDPSQKSPQWQMEMLDVVVKAMHIRAKYRQVCHDTPVYSADDYISIISSHTGYEIDWKTYDWRSYHLRGGLLNYDGNKAKIAVAKHRDEEEGGLTTCEQRFIVIKEASHLIVDDKESYIKDCTEFIDDILLAGLPSPITDFSSSTRSDIFYSKIFAMELLFPWEYRQQALNEINSGSKQYIDVAKQFMIPEKELRWFLNDRLHLPLQQMHIIHDDIMQKVQDSFTDKGA